MTDPTASADPDAPREWEPPEIPPVIEFHQNTFKLKTMSLLSLLVAAWFLWIAVGAAIEGARPAPLESAGGQPAIAELPAVEGPAAPAPAPGSEAEIAPQGPGQPPSPLIAGVGGLMFALMGLILFREAAKTEPILRLTPEGIEDRQFGFVPWANLRNYRLVSSFFSPGFGYSLKKGVRPRRRAGLFMFQRAMNALSGMPARCFRKQMVVGGCEQMLMAFQMHRPELEGK
ncbi:hypothetical protein [uncultured Albimonas sp.]|uniref:hypothetical protein n=1 Tax=uncultured Albimonas sp. TaxID=1331701 RepID=UPI0030EF26F8